MLTDLGYKSPEAPRVSPEKDAAHVAADLMGAAQDQAPHEARRLPSQTQVYVNKGGEREEGDEHDVDCEVWSVAVDAHFDGT